MKQNEKIEKFLKEYGELVKKYNVDFAPYPLFVPSERGEFKVVCQNTPVDLDEINKKDFIST